MFAKTILPRIWALLALLPLPAAAATHPHIVIILADDLGYGDPGCNNAQSKIATPNIDGLARDGLRFTDAHSPASWCTPTRYGLLTGRYPFRTELAWRRKPVIESGRPTLPGMLRRNGYRTAMVGKWHLGFDAPEVSKRHAGGPIDRGFDRYFGIPASLDIPPYYYMEGDRPVAPPIESIGDRDTPGWTRIQGEFWRAGGIAPGFEHVEVLPNFTQRAVQEIHRHGELYEEQPLFLYVALTAPHTPWLPTPEFAGQSEVPLYGDFVMQVDDTVGRIMAALREAEMEQDTLVIFSSDNGPVWYPHDERKYNHRSTAVYRGMKGDAWEGGHRMPLLMRWPERIRPGRVTSRLACLTDLFATCAAIVGHELSTDEAEDSFSLLPVLLDQSPTSATSRQTLVVNSTADFMAVRRGPWKLIPFRGSGGFSEPKIVRDPPPGEPEGQLYDLKEDPAETKNLYGRHPEIVEELTALLERIREAGRSRPE